MDDAQHTAAPRDVVAALLSAHGLDVPAADLDALGAVYPAIRQRMARIHAVACGDEG